VPDTHTKDFHATALPGVLAPVLTPFDSDLQPDCNLFVRMCRWLVAQDAGLAMFGTNSEGNSLSVDERRHLLDAVLDAGVPASRMLPGTGSCSLTDAVSLTRTAVAAGCAGVLVLPPFYYKGVSDDGLFAFFSELVERVGDARLRIYLYHIPPVAQVGISEELIERLLKRYPQAIAGIKDTGGDWEYTGRVIDQFSESGFEVYAGTETILLKTLRRGGRGCISATANVNPAQIVALQRQWCSAEADQMQQALNDLRAVFQAYPLIAAMKSALANATGLADWNRVRPPLQALSAQQVSILSGQLEAHGFSLRDF
jgi:4-hydroxy-tetrahydrodipicolinate synthase